MILSFCIFISFLNASQCMSYNRSVDLVTDVLTGYNTRQRPVLDQSDTVNISVSLFISSIRELDEVTGMFSALGFLSMTWTDEMISWIPAQYDGASRIDLKLSDIWYPKLVLANPYSKIDDLAENWMMVSVTSNGLVSFRPGSLFESTCSIDVTYYPFDTQKCNLKFVAWGYTGSDVGLYSADEVKTSDFMENGEWLFESATVVRKAGNSQAADNLIYKFTIRRRSLYLVTNVVLPILFMALINLLVFILPMESGERLSFSITVLLALAVYMTMVGENLPKTSEPMSLLSFYLLAILLLSTFITVATVFDLEIYHRDGEVSQYYKSFTRKMRCSTCRRRGRNTLMNIKIGIVTEKENKDNNSNDSGESDWLPTVTWHDVSAAVDRICLVAFSLTSIMVNAGFLVFLRTSS